MWRQLNCNKPQGSIAASATLAVLLMLVTTVGCGPAGEPTGTIKGTVMSGDKIIGNCRVAISNKETRITKAAVVDQDGNFKMVEIPFGEYNVIVFPTPTQTDEAIPDPRIPKNIRSFKTSDVTTSVSTSDEIVLDIDLKE